MEMEFRGMRSNVPIRANEAAPSGESSKDRYGKLSALNDTRIDKDVLPPLQAARMNRNLDATGREDIVRDANLVLAEVIKGGGPLAERLHAIGFLELADAEFKPEDIAQTN